MNLTGIRVLLFDVNGVLIDSNPANAMALARAFTDDDRVQGRIVRLYLEMPGIDRGTKIRRIQEQIIGRPFAQDEFERIWERARRFTRGAMIGAPLLPGVRETLERLGSLGLTRVALSNTPEPELRDILSAKGIDGLFDVIRGGGDRPKSESLMRVVEELKLDPRACLFFGDGRGDLRAARHAGIAFVAIAAGTGEFDGETELHGPYKSLGDWAGETLLGR